MSINKIKKKSKSLQKMNTHLGLCLSLAILCIRYMYVCYVSVTQGLILSTGVIFKKYLTTYVKWDVYH